ncbi:MAG: LPS-assembly protein LptD, partial [Myxococcales bacterium]
MARSLAMLSTQRRPVWKGLASLRMAPAPWSSLARSSLLRKCTDSAVEGGARLKRRLQPDDVWTPRRAPAVVVAAVLCLATWCGVPGADPLDLEADHVSYDNEEKRFIAEGNVRLQWKGSLLETDFLTVEQTTRRIVAEGGLRLSTPDLKLEAASCDLDVDDETGRFRDVEIRAEDLGLTLGGKEVRKRQGPRYVLTDGYYTTCMTGDGRTADWSLSGQSVDVDVGGYGVIRNGAFRVKDVPVLYLPYLAFPASQERQSGLLLPEVGASNKRGFVLRQPGFWAIDKHQDLTLTGVVESSARLGVGATYRYRPDRFTFGELEAAYYNERIRGDAESDIESPLFADSGIPENRWLIGGRHRQRWRPNIELYGDALLVSDDLYLREIEPTHVDYMEDSLRRSLRYTVNRGGVLARQGFSSLGARSIAYQDFVDDQKQTLHRPAELWANMDGAIGGLGFVLGGEMTRFLRREGVDGTRLDANATFSRDITPRGPLLSNVWMRGRVNGYQLDERSVLDSDGDEIEKLSDFAVRGVGETGLGLRTVLQREFGLRRTKFSTAIAGVKAETEEEGAPSQLSMLHLVEPFSTLRFTWSGDEDDVPLYDEEDRYDDRTTLTYGVAQRFFFRDRDDKQREERARLSVGQTYNLENKVIDDHLSDID